MTVASRTSPDWADEPKASIPFALWVLIAVSFFVSLGFGLIAPVLPHYAVSFGVSNTGAALVVSLYAVARIAFAPVAGVLIERWGERTVYMTGLVVLAASTLTTAFAASYGELLTFRSVGGIGSVMFNVAAGALLIRVAPEEIRGRAVGILTSSLFFGDFVGPVVGGLLAGFGARLPFVLYGLLLLACALVILIFVRNVHGHQASTARKAPAMLLRDAFTDRRYVSSLGSSFATGWANIGVRPTLIPLLVVSMLHSGPLAAGLAMGAFALGNALTLYAAGALSDRVGRKPLVIIGLVVGGVAQLLIGLSPTIAMLCVWSVVAGIGAGVLNPAQQAAVADVIGRERSGGRVLAVSSMAVDCGMVIGPLAAGAISDHAGFGWAFGISAALLAGSAIPWLFTRPSVAQAKTV